MTIYEAGSSDLLFFYDTADLRVLVEADIFNVVVQPPMSMFYNRGYGCGLQMRENIPNSASAQVSIRADIAIAFANRNRQVTGGVNGYPDRRAYASQSTVAIEQNPQTGEIDVQIGYILSGDVSSLMTTKVAGGR